MNINSIVLVLIVCTILVCVSLSRAEELCVINNKSIDARALTSLEGIDVYAYLENGFLIGTDMEGRDLLLQMGLLAGSLGERDHSSRYFLFQILSEDIGKLSSDIEVIRFEGTEAIARIDKGTELDRTSLGVMRLLTYISFTPIPAVERMPVSPPHRLLPDPQIEIIVSQVSETTYTAFIQSLQDFVTRYVYTDSCRAAEQWATDTFSGLGLESELWPYSYDGNTWYNAIGRKIGTVYPDSIYMIIGHIDDISENPYYDAPGAEDNGSGSACVLETARVLSQFDFDCTIEFVLVSGEELGLIGSEAYAEYCANTGRNIAGVFNFDMISYAGSWGWDTNIYADQNFQAEADLADLLAQLTDEYSSAYSVRVDTDGPTYGSDHYYFSLYGFPAPFSIDAQLWGAPDWYPWYHTTGDVITHLDLDFGTEVVKGSVAALATVANPSVPPLSTGLIPDEYPTIVPQGGTFGMTASVTNNGSEATTTDVWLGAYRSTHFFLQRLYEDVPMAAGQTRQAHFLQAVPGFTPPGDYSYVEFCGDYTTWTVVDSSFFTVTVTGAASAAGGLQKEGVRGVPFTILEGSEGFLE